MSYLLDTHALIWFLENNSSLDIKAKTIIEDEKNKIFISVASFWEMAIKIQLGKLTLTYNLEEVIKEAKILSIETLPLETSNFTALLQLPLHHRDPFDRIIIAQAIAENLSIISVDEQFDAYPIKRIWR